jgi:DNA-binding response OmpR family regulator
MKAPSAVEVINDKGTVAVLSVSPMDEDHSLLESIFSHSKWTLFKAPSLPAARAFLQGRDVSVVVCERDLGPGSWRAMLEYLQPLPHPPSLIVTSRLADDRLWSEVLNLGGWDVLAKPFDRGEVVRSIKLAWDHWRHQAEPHALAAKAAS